MNIWAIIYYNLLFADTFSLFYPGFDAIFEHLHVYIARIYGGPVKHVQAKYDKNTNILLHLDSMEISKTV